MKRLLIVALLLCGTSEAFGGERSYGRARRVERRATVVRVLAAPFSFCLGRGCR